MIPCSGERLFMIGDFEGAVKHSGFHSIKGTIAREAQGWRSTRFLFGKIFIRLPWAMPRNAEPNRPIVGRVYNSIRPSCWRQPTMVIGTNFM